MKVKIIANKKQLKEWSLDRNFKKGEVYDVAECKDNFTKWYKCCRYGYNIPEEFVEVIGETTNRDFLKDFVKLNNIKTTLVSKSLGKSQNWLTQMMNDKRRDMTDKTLQEILKKLHIDWTSSQFLNVKPSGSYVGYRTKPCNYKTNKHKLVLQRAFWDGLVKA